jgi:hypothetical protein
MKRHDSHRYLLVSTVIVTILVFITASVSSEAEEALFLKQSFSGGFTLKEPVRFYNPGDLYEYINGQAVYYMSYGFKRLEHGVYTIDDKEYIVDVYELASRLSAFGAYRQQRDSEAENADIGVECAVLDYLTTLYKGKYYIEIIPAGTGSEDPQTMKKLAAQVTEMVPGETDLPPEVNLFPEENLIEGSERYVDENLLSYSVMGNGLTAHYKQPGDSDLRVFLALPEDTAAAKKVYDGFLEKIEDTSLRKLEKAQGIKGTTPYRGTAIMYLRDRFVFGCLSVQDEEYARTVLEALYEKLKRRYNLE